MGGRHGVVIVVVTRKDIDPIIDGVNFITLLREKRVWRPSRSVGAGQLESVEALGVPPRDRLSHAHRARQTPVARLDPAADSRPGLAHRAR